MAGASYVQSSFIGGLVSKFTQGRYHDQHYRTWLNDCFNGLPIETESWVRRPGFALAGPTRAGLPAKLARFDFNATAPYTLEFTNQAIRFWQANQLATTNDSVGLVSISGANPAVLTLASAVNWATGDVIFISGLAATCPTLQNRRLNVTKVDTTHFSISDEISGVTINGSGIGTPAATAIVNHVALVVTPYAAGSWANLRVVQTGIAAFLLHPQFPPYELIVNSQPTPASFATFSLPQSFFEDGPYLDPIPGSTITPGATSGIVTLTLGFQAYSSTTAYTIGEFVTSSGVGYVSIADANVNNTPVSSPTFWKVVGFGAAINNGQGFLASDIGRLVRLFSEPAQWASGTTYAQGAIVSFNPTGLPGGNVYYSSLVGSNTGNTPGTDATHWSLTAIGSAQNPAIWTWGKITSISATGAISGATGSNIGNMTSNGGLSAAFDGVTSKTFANSAMNEVGFADGYVGKNYGGQTIGQVVIYPSSDLGFSAKSSGGPFVPASTVRLKLRGKASAPSTPSDGTVLADTGIVSNSFSPVTLVSNDTVTSWNYAWVEIIYTDGGTPFASAVSAAQVIFYSASAVPGTSVNCEILGPPLLYSSVTVQTWRLGLYSNTTGWPNVGTYAEGRLWLASAAFPNRIDACVADGISGVNNGALAGVVNFAPTDQFGNVTEANAIDYTFNSPAVDSILWMIPDLQGILCGTLSGEWIVQAPSSGGISPTNIVARRMTVIGCANIEPRRTEHTIVVVQRYLRKIVEYFADVFSGKFTAPNLIKDAKQLTIGNIQEIAYQQELAPILWARVNGLLIGCTYKRDTLMTSSGPTIAAWHQHGIGGPAGAVFESMVVGSSLNGTLDALAVVTNDPNTSVRWVQVLSPILDEGATLASAGYLDASLAASSTVIAAPSGSMPYGGLTINGLWPLNGYTITAWIGGLDCGDYTVSNGSITVPYGDGIGNGQGSFPASSGANRSDQGLFTQAFVNTGKTANGVQMFTYAATPNPTLFGFTYTSRGEIVRPNAPAESGARSGPAFGKKRRNHWIMAQFEGSQGVSWGSTKSRPVPFNQSNGAPYTVDLQFTGIVRDNVDSEYDFGGDLHWLVTRPYICNVQAIGSAIETQDI